MGSPDTALHNEAETVEALESFPPHITKGRTYKIDGRFVAGYGRFARPHIWINGDSGERVCFFASRFTAVLAQPIPGEK